MPDNVTIAHIHNLLDSIIYSIVPFIFMVSCSIIIFFKLKSLKCNKNYEKKKREFDFAKTIITMDILFLILNSPICILGIILLNYDMNHFVPTEKQEKIIDLVYTVFLFLMYLHSSIPFFVQISFNKIFREELFTMYSKIKEIFIKTRTNCLFRIFN